MDFVRASQTAPDNGCIRREAWVNTEKKVRPARESDMDYIGVLTIENIWVEDCEKPMDCKIRIWVPAEEDIDALDWEIVNCNSKKA